MGESESNPKLETSARKNWVVRNIKRTIFHVVRFFTFENVFHFFQLDKNVIIHLFWSICNTWLMIIVIKFFQVWIINDNKNNNDC